MLLEMLSKCLDVFLHKGLPLTRRGEYSYVSGVKLERLIMTNWIKKKKPARKTESTYIELSIEDLSSVSAANGPYSCYDDPNMYIGIYVPCDVLEEMIGTER